MPLLHNTKIRALHKASRPRNRSSCLLGYVHKNFDQLYIFLLDLCIYKNENAWYNAMWWRMGFSTGCIAILKNFYLWRFYIYGKKSSICGNCAA